MKGPPKREVVDFRQKQLAEFDSRVFGQDFSQISDCFVSTDRQPELDLPRRLVDVEHGDVDGQELLLWNGQRDAEERVKRFALPATRGACQGGVELRLEHVHDEAAENQRKALVTTQKKTSLSLF